MVELKSNDQAKKLGAIATFLDIPVTVSPHKSLNSSKGVIRSLDLRCCSEEEMVEELMASLTLGASRCCYKCQRYGHGKDRCKKPAAVCVRCGKGGHVERDCSADPHCVNCKGDHTASSKTCPKFLEEQAILRYKAENGGTFQQARKAVVVEIHKTISIRTFASAVKSQLRTKPAELPKDGGRSDLLPRPRGKKPRRILRLPVPREQQKPKSNFEELKLLLNRSQSAVVALQECRLGEGQVLPRGYTLLLPQGGSPGGEAALLIRNRTRFSEIDLKTGLHAAVATISLEKTLTVCSLYLPPNSPGSKLSLPELFEQLPKPFLVLGDFNAHSPAWGDSHRDGRGRMLEEFTAENDLIILNSGEQTFVHSAYHSTSAIDLAVASPSIAAECSWAAHSDLCGSDHFPIFLKLSSNFSSNVNTSFNF
ncbi:RNA-directed DNA polymerase from mobile element jockey [Plakobranchus ocellatus]|uniref:RNA-directed DNA polymerase from mobile element jockey n=1 Tax=Plakobranchus ocellatus TaxID=259542 RepID=A0AAV4BEB5_9GAST|nr:RNA-directed DNA polymerase from mobile element jockey [Plakobranchus ocellatus]